MARSFKIFISLIFLFNFSCFSMNCAQLSGKYSGTYFDSYGLFSKQNFPITLILAYKNNNIYGYTFFSKDNKGGSFGSTINLIWGKCQNSIIKNFHILTPTATCGANMPKQHIKYNANKLTLNLPWENAMTQTTFTASLKRVKMHSFNNTLINLAIKRSHENIKTCH